MNYKKLNDWIDTFITWIISAVCLFFGIIVLYLLFITSVSLGCLLSFTILIVILKFWLEDKIEEQ